jgi:hypothetical protein
MSLRSRSALLLLPALLVGCASSGNFVQEMEPQAMDSAQRRGAFEMDCPTAKADLLSSQLLQPAVRTFVYTGPERAEYTVGVEGCGKRTSYIVICPDNGSNTCFDGGSRTVIESD